MLRFRKYIATLLQNDFCLICAGRGQVLLYILASVKTLALTDFLNLYLHARIEITWPRCSSGKCNQKTREHSLSLDVRWIRYMSSTLLDVRWIGTEHIRSAKNKWYMLTSTKKPWLFCICGFVSHIFVVHGRFAVIKSRKREHWQTRIATCNTSCLELCCATVVIYQLR